MGKKPKLMKVNKEFLGKINLYSIEFSQSVGSPGGFGMGSHGGFGMGPTFSINSSQYYVNKGSGDVVIYLGTSHPMNGGHKKFSKAAMKFFTDCPDILEKIKSKEFKQKQIPEIVEYYASECDGTSIQKNSKK